MLLPARRGPPGSVPMTLHPQNHRIPVEQAGIAWGSAGLDRPHRHTVDTHQVFKSDLGLPKSGLWLESWPAGILMPGLNPESEVQGSNCPLSSRPAQSLQSLLCAPPYPCGLFSFLVWGCKGTPVFLNPFSALYF